MIRLRSQVVWDYLALKKRPQNWLADELGISRGHLSMLLNHDRAPLGQVMHTDSAVPGRGGFR